MTTLDSLVPVQLPSRDYGTETVRHASLCTITSTISQDDLLHPQAINASAHAADFSALPTLESQSNTAHRRWRPRFHPMPPTGWLNDPCAPGYDPINDVYHVGFQWNPKKPEWGDISWGSALSKDLVFWETGDFPSMKPSTKHDGEAGVFTGCWSPVTAVAGQNTAFYTSARILPIHHTLSYNRGSEAICMATTADVGRTWQRGPSSTVLQGPPPHLQVTGWRDPFVAQWPTLSRVLGKDSDQALFGIVSGGVRNSGPTVFLYSIDRINLTTWNFISVLTIAPTLREAHSSHWEPDYGANWEVVNFLSLPDPDDPTISHEILIIGVEGRKKLHAKTSGRHRHSDFRRDHLQMWVSGTLAKTSAGMQMQFCSGGALDHGGLYAVNSFRDPKYDRQVAFGWIVEEDLPEEMREIQGWAGLLSLPRVVQLKRMRHVVHALKSDLVSIKSFHVVMEEHRPQNEEPQTYSITTLCALPDPRINELRQTLRTLGPATYGSLPEALGSLNFPTGCSCWEVNMSFDIGADVERIGFIIGHTKGKHITNGLTTSS